MKITRYIYQGMLFPLLAFLLAGSVTGCSNDPTMEEDMSGKSTLTIKMRGITTTAPSSTSESYDNYVKTLRIIGYDNAGNVVCNQRYEGTELGKVYGTGDDTYIEITQTLREAFAGGVCSFYFIANEDEYNVYNSTNFQQSLTNFLDNSNTPSKTELEGCIISFESSDNFTPGYPILMTVQTTTQYLKPGNNDIGTISLVRCLAKVQLKITNKSNQGDVIVSNIKLKGSYPDSYSLWNTHNYTNYIAKSIDRTLYNINESGYIFASPALLFPEKLIKGGNTDTDTDLKYTFTLTSGNTSKNYDVNIGTGNQNTITDYNIYRNYWFTTFINFLGWQSQIMIDYKVADWINGSNYIIGFDYPTYGNPITPTSGETPPYNQPTIYYNNDATSNDGVFNASFTITAPVGQNWQPTLFDATIEDYEITVYQGDQKIEPPYGISDSPYTIKVRALKETNVGKEFGIGISYTPLWDMNASSLLLINGTENDTKWNGSNDPQKIIIKQEDVPSIP